MISDDAFATWRTRSNASRAVLIEMEHSAGTVYLANRVYRSGPTDTPANQAYLNRLQNFADVEEYLEGELSLGEIRVAYDERLEDWLGYRWYGYPGRILIGDPAWSRDDFRVVAVFSHADLLGASAGELRFGARDPKAVLDVPLQLTKLSTGGPVPIALGQPFNVQPVLTNDNTHQYRVDEVTPNAVVVRDNGAPLSPALGIDGHFTVSSRPSGEIGVDVIKAEDSAAEIIAWLCARNNQSVNSDSLAALPTYPLGLYYDRNTTAVAVLDDVMGSLGGAWLVNASEEVEVFQYQGPGESATLTLTEYQDLDGGLELLERRQPLSALTLNYRRNFKVHNRASLAGIVDVTPDLAEALSTEWQSVTASNVLVGHRHAPEETVNTYLVDSADASSEVSRRIALRADITAVWRMTASLWPAEVRLGDTVEIRHTRFGFTAGVLGVVIARLGAWTRRGVTLEVLI